MAECLRDAEGNEYVIMTDSEDHDYSNAGSSTVQSRPPTKASVTKIDNNYKQAIPKECVLLIIKLYKENAAELNGQNKRHEKRNLWTKIARAIQDQGFPMDAAQCNQKWRNMLRDYTMFLEKLAQQPSGQTAPTPPWYFLQMADALNERQFLSITDADSTMEGGDSLSSTAEEVQQPFTVIPLASSLAMSGSAKQFYNVNSTGDTADPLQANFAGDSDEEATGTLATVRKRRKTHDEGKPIKTSTDHKLIIQAIRDAEIARKEEDDARHMSLLQELRRQHFEKMTVLNKLVDALTANNSS